MQQTEAPVWLVFDGTLPIGDPSSLSFMLESNADTLGLSYSIEFFNWTTQEYLEFATSDESFNVDTVKTIDIANNISEFVDSKTGQVRTRIGWRKTGFTFLFPWTVCIDNVTWTVN